MLYSRPFNRVVSPHPNKLFQGRHKFGGAESKGRRGTDEIKEQVVVRQDGVFTRQAGNKINITPLLSGADCSKWGNKIKTKYYSKKDT